MPGPLLVAVTVKVTMSFRCGAGWSTVFVTAMSTPTGIVCDAGADVMRAPVGGCADAVAVLVSNPVAELMSAARRTYCPVQVVEELKPPPGASVVGGAQVTVKPLSSVTAGAVSVTVPVLLTL